jgi:glutathione S-transferase
MMREADQYVGPALQQLALALRTAAGEEKSAAAAAELQREFALWETAVAGDYLTGTLSAADITLYPQVALAQRVLTRAKGAVPAGFLGPKLAAWARRMEALPVTRKTLPPHWK